MKEQTKVYGARVVQKRRYFFNITDGDNSILDRNGIHLASDAHARGRLFSSAQDVVLALNPTITVTDELGRVVSATSYENALKSSLASSSANTQFQLENRESMLLHTEVLSGVGGWELDLKHGRLEWTDGTFRLFDLAVGTAPAYRASLKLFTAPSRLLLIRSITAAISQCANFDIELKIKSATGASKWIRMVGQCEQVAGVASRIRGFVVDISGHRAIRQESYRLANQDALTGLGNRRKFQKQLADALSRAKEKRKKVALILLDLDNLKIVNDTQGHAIGDRLLKGVGDLLKSIMHPGDIVARIGGDEFAIIKSDVESALDIVPFVESIQSRLRNDTWDTQLSVGIAVYPDHDEDFDGLLKSADIALYAAKAAGRGALCIFSPEMRLSLLKRVAALESARNGIRKSQFIPFYQPLFSLTSGAIVGFEALVRWDHPDKGLLLPEVLEHAFGDGDLASAIGVVVLEKTIANIRCWTEQGYNFGRIGINVTPLELSRTHFARQFLDRVSTGGISATTIEVEVTENTLVGRGSEIIAANLHELSAAGVAIALDDFGTGYGSLIHLRQMPINTLKIDRSFIRDMKDDIHAKAIVCALINLAHSLQIKSVAEGVETQEQADYLAAQGCDRAQGFLFAPALPSDQIVKLFAPQPAILATTK